MQNCTFRPELIAFEERKRSLQAKTRNSLSANANIDLKINTSRGFDDIISDQKKFLDLKNKKRELE